MQFGIYCVEGFNIKTQVRKFMWETVDSIPSTATISQSAEPVVVPDVPVVVPDVPVPEVSMEELVDEFKLHCKDYRCIRSNITTLK